MNKKIEQGITGLSMLVIAGIVFTFAAASGFTFPNAHDDFSLANRVSGFLEQNNNLLAASVRYMLSMYEGWQGTYASSLFLALFSPLNGYGIVQLRIVMVLTTIFFFVSLYAFVFCAWRYYDQSIRWNHAVMVYALIIVALTGFKGYREIFYWYVGAIPYTGAISLLFLMGAVLFSAMKYEKRSLYIIAGTLAFVVSGSVLQMTALNCYMLLLIAIFHYRSRGCVAVFCSALCGAILNAAAPGNFARHDMIDSSGLHFIDTAVMSLSVYWNEVKWLLFETPFIAVLLLGILFGICVPGSRKKERCALKAAALLILPLAAIYPVSLGYSGMSFPNRCQFILDVTLIMLMMWGAVACGQWVWCKVKNMKNIRVYMCAGILVCTYAWIYVGGGIFHELKSIQTCEQLINGEIPRYAEECIQVYRDIKESDEKDVVIDKLPKPIENFIPFELQTDAAHGINQQIAEYYGKNTVRVKQE